MYAKKQVTDLQIVDNQKLNKEFFIIELLSEKKLPTMYPGQFVQALIDLGINKAHDYLTVKNRLKEIMEKKNGIDGVDQWTKFSTRKIRNEQFAKNLDGKIMEIPKMLQRINGYHPYGKKLQQLDACIDIFECTNELPMYRLRTNVSSSENPLPMKPPSKRGRKKTKKD